MTALDLARQHWRTLAVVLLAVVLLVALAVVLGPSTATGTAAIVAGAEVVRRREAARVRHEEAAEAAVEALPDVDALRATATQEDADIAAEVALVPIEELQRQEAERRR